MSDRITLHCWKCGALQRNVLLPFSRSQECSACMADLHVCFGCENYRSHSPDQCNEERAESVTHKERANFCDFFSASSRPVQARDLSEENLAKAKLAELFGETPPRESAAKEKENSNQGPELSESEKALAELNRLFSKD